MFSILSTIKARILPKAFQGTTQCLACLFNALYDEILKTLDTRTLLL
jgi:hypothetical protein